MKALLACVLPLFLVSAGSAAETLDIYVLDTEGGKAVIVMTPEGQTMLTDAGYPMQNDRDTNRIVEAAESLKITEFDYIVATHYDADHGGNIPNLAARIPAKVYVDHGEILPSSNERDKKNFYEPYLKFVADKQRLIVKPGDEISMKGLNITVVSSGGKAITSPLQGAGQRNELFADTPRPDVTDNYDNAGSVGLMFEFGTFRMLDLADQLQPGEYDLVHPRNLLGTVDLFMVSHHGFKVSNSKILIHTIRPKVAVMNNGARKGGEAEVFDILANCPGLEDLWQLHYATRTGEKNRPEQFIANPESPCQAKMIKISARPDGTFTVTNTRNNFTKTYHQDKQMESTQDKRDTMIMDRLDKAEQYYEMHPAFEKAFAFLQRVDLPDLPDGRHEIEGDRIFALISRGPGKNRRDTKLEAHRKYIDIQYIISGTDEMGWRPTADCRDVETAYQADNDIEFFKDQPQRWTKVPAGSFAIFSPQDAHAPMIGSGEIHKVVLKILNEKD